MVLTVWITEAVRHTVSMVLTVSIIEAVRHSTNGTYCVDYRSGETHSAKRYFLCGIQKRWDTQCQWYLLCGLKKRWDTQCQKVLSVWNTEVVRHTVPKVLTVWNIKAVSPKVPMVLSMWITEAARHSANGTFYVDYRSGEIHSDSGIVGMMASWGELLLWNTQWYGNLQKHIVKTNLLLSHRYIRIYSILWKCAFCFRPSFDNNMAAVCRKLYTEYSKIFDYLSGELYLVNRYIFSLINIPSYCL
jgi:hypothetical protein